MIAYGHPEMIDPTPADGLMMMLKPFRKELEEKYIDGVNAENAQQVAQDIIDHIKEMMG